MSSPPPPPLPTRFQPVAEDRRSLMLDVLRGFAIFGIFLVNMSGLKSPLLSEETVAGIFGFQSLNQAANVSIEVFAAGKFVSLFAFVFGMGLVMQEGRSQVAGRPFAVFQLRRMAVLLGFGIPHALLLWAGDILAVYAVIGMLGLCFLRVPTKALVIWVASLMAGFLFLGLALGALMALTGNEPDEDMIMLSTWTTESYRSGSFLRLVAARAAEWALCWACGLFTYLPYTFAVMLTGMLAARANVLDRLEEWQPRLPRLLTIILPAGLLCGGFYAYAAHAESAMSWLMIPGLVCFYLSMPLLSTSYILIIHQGLRSARFPILTRHLAAVGRLSLSHYLLQSLIANILFMGWGFGLYGKIEAWLGALIVVAVFAIQCWISPIWLRRYETGPMEWLWRALAYGQKPKMKRARVGI
jgi:uncharacterized protein